MKCINSIKTIWRLADRRVAKALSNPQAEQELYIEDGEEEIRSFRKTIQEAMAENKSLLRTIEENELVIKTNTDNARKAMQEGDSPNEIEAKACLFRKHQAIKNLEVLKEQYEASEKYINKSKEQLSEMNWKLEEHKREVKLLALRSKNAKVRDNLVLAGQSFSKKKSVFGLLESFKTSVNEMEDLVEAGEELQNEQDSTSSEASTRYSEIQKSVEEELKSLS